MELCLNEISDGKFARLKSKRHLKLLDFQNLPDLFVFFRFQSILRGFFIYLKDFLHNHTIKVFVKLRNLPLTGGSFPPQLYLDDHTST